MCLRVCALRECLSGTSAMGPDSALELWHGALTILSRLQRRLFGAVLW